MQFEYSTHSGSRVRHITMSHEGESLEWTLGGKYRDFHANEFVFGDINNALSQLDEETQTKLWGCYKQIHLDCLNISNRDRLEKKIIQQFKIIEELLPYAKVDKLLRYDNSVWVPPDPVEEELQLEHELKNFDASYDEIEQKEKENARDLSKQLTYTKEDYHDLNVLIVYVKLFLPVLTVYRDIIAEEVDDIFQCMKTLHLIESLNFTQDKGYRRLYHYIVHYWQGKTSKDLITSGALLKGLSKEMAVKWIISELFYRRLLPVGISHTYHPIEDKDRPNFIKGLFHNVEQCALSFSSGRNSGFFKNKGFQANEGNEEEQMARMEMWKVVSEIPDSSIEINSVYAENIDNLLRHVDPTLPLELVEKVEFQRRYHLSYNPYRKTIMKWLMSKAMTPQFIDYITEKAYSNCFRITVALLQHWGFHDIAELVDGRFYPEDDKEMSFGVIPITVEQLGKLAEFYPHEIESNRVKGESRRESNFATRACGELQDMIRGMRYIGLNYPGEHYANQPIEWLTASLIIHLNENQFI